tara:strand:+ start:56 stop:1261 length:1206 start_codon:yes stop_codon:yes gene_type:complete
MEIDKPYLFIEINEKNFVFLAVKYNENFSFEVLHSISTNSNGVRDGIIYNTEISLKIIKESLNTIEKKINFIFRSATIIINHNNFTCTNISGFKRLNGSQVLEGNISYIINNLKKIVLDNEPEKHLVHLFNTDFALDGVVLKNLPVGLHGNFYNHHLTFFLLPKNEYKNFKFLLNSCNLNIDRIISKSLTKGMHKIFNNKDHKRFAIIHFGKEESNISVFSRLSFVYSETFNFGTDVIMKDVSKVCSLNFENVKNFFRDIDFNQIYNEEKSENYLDKKFFTGEKFRKISLNLLNKIITARVDELINLTFKDNINLKYSKGKLETVYLTFDDLNIAKSFKKKFETETLEEAKVKFDDKTQDELLNGCLISAELTGKGWEREAIPTIQTKKSIISRLFSIFFK